MLCYQSFKLKYDKVFPSNCHFLPGNDISPITKGLKRTSEFASLTLLTNEKKGKQLKMKKKILYLGPRVSQEGYTLLL